MRLLHTFRWVLLALLLSVIPASSYAGVFISVGFAPPVLPVYAQPMCPGPGMIWTPGYWAYGDDGYYWVPGQWVPAPYVGALWTPPYWGWDDGLYVFHPGYWAPHVGYYGGVNYGFGYFGVGFLGGEWRGRDFYYNRAVWRVDEHRIHEYYEDRRDWDRYRVDRDRHVSYSGGPGGIRHEPNEMERRYMRDQHMERTSFQERNQREAMGNRNAYARFNGGRPANAVVDHSRQNEMRQPQGNYRQGWQNGNVNRSGASNNPAMEQRGNQAWQRGNQDMQRGNQNWQQRPTPQSYRQQPQYQQNENPRNQNWQQRSYPQQGQGYQTRQMQPSRTEPQYQQRGNQAWQQRQMTQSNRQQPQYQQRENPRFQSRPEPQPRQQAPQNRPEPAPRGQGRPGSHGR